MRSALRCLRLLYLFAVTFLAIGDGLAANGATPKHVLIIQSFGGEVAPYDTITSVFRTELAKRFPEPVVFLEATLDAGRSVTSAEEQAFVEYLRARFAARAPDLVVTIGQPAARFYVAHRDQLFPSPYLMAALDERLANRAALRPTDAASLGKVDLPRLVENVLKVLPDTTTIAVVIGASRLEQFWLNEMQRELAELPPRVRRDAGLGHRVFRVGLWRVDGEHRAGTVR
jgi:hypothetical protein